VDGTVPQAKIKACSICDPYVLVLREDDTIGLFIDAQRGKVRRKDMSPMGDKVISEFIDFLKIWLILVFKDFTLYSGLFFNDISDIFQPQLLNHVTNDVQSVATTSQAAVTTGGHSQWLILVGPQDVVEVCV
jgi:cleavage and polyadenylation specificity factor subunit 1